MQAESTAVSLENEDHFVSLAGQAQENIKDCLHFKAIVSVVFRGGFLIFARKFFQDVKKHAVVGRPLGWRLRSPESAELLEPPSPPSVKRAPWHELP